MSENWKAIKCALICALGSFLLIVVAGPARLEAQVETATISGSVTDSSSAVLVGATVQAKNTGTSTTQSAVTDSQGRYRLSDLPIGNYELQASAKGFQTVVHKGITLTVGSQPVDDFTLPVGQTTQIVEVQDQVSQVETQTATVSTLISAAQVHDLPLNGRNFEQLLTLAPGVQRIEQVAAGGGGGSSFYGAMDNYSVSGSRPVGQAFLLDSTDTRNFFDHGTGSGVSGTSLGIEAIQEFQVLTNTYSAEFGGTGAAVNAASKSGTNTLHGSGYEYFRNSALDATGFFDVTKPPFRRNQFSASLGGPIKKDRLFFFVNYEGLRQSLGQTGRANVPEAYVHNGQVPCNQAPGLTCTGGMATVGVNPKVAGILALYPLPNPGVVDQGGFGLYTTIANLVANENYVLGRVDYNLSSRDSLFMRFVSDRADQIQPFSASQIPLWPEHDNTANQYFSIEERRSVSASVLNSVRFSFVRTREAAVTSNSTPPLDFFPGSGRQNGSVGPAPLSPIGASGTVPFFIVQNKFFGGDDVLWTHGSHSLKMGVSVGRVQTNLGAPFNVGGNFLFGGIVPFLQAHPFLFLGMSAPSPDFSINRYFREIDMFPYVQDDWKVTPRLTLNLGLRYEFVTNAVGVGVPLFVILNPLTSSGFTQVKHVLASNPNNKSFDPRIGLAFDPFNDHKTAIRAGFGIFHEPVSPRTYAPSYYLAPPSGATLVLDLSFIPGLPPLGFPNPYAGGSLPYSAFAGLDYHTDTAPYVMQYNLTIEHQIAAGTVASIGYIGSSGVHLFSERNQNLP